MSRDLFGFKDEPFSAYPDNKYFFSSIHHDKAITLLEYGLNSRKGFMLLTGLKGTGKTMTCNIMKDSVTDCNVSIVNYEAMTPDALMKKICTGFGLENAESGRKALFGQIMEYFVDQYKEGHNNLIIIDNAENISDENLLVLGEFMEIEIEKCKLVQVILSGCPELHDRLKHLDGELGPKFTFTVELAPLSLKDTADYVEHRIQTAIGEEEHLFKNNSLTEIYNYSKGIPSEINRIAHKALAIAKEKKQTRITPRHVKMAAARLYGVKGTRKGSKTPYVTIMILIMLALGGYFFRTELMNAADRAVSLLNPEKEVVAVVSPEPEPDPEPSFQEPVIEEPAVMEEPGAVDEPVSEETPAEDALRQTEEVLTAEIPAEEPVVTPAEPEPLPEQEPLAPEPVVQDPAVQHGCITAQSGLKVRSEASVSGELIGTAPYMAYIELLELSADGQWWKTNYNETTGYMYGAYIQVVDSPEQCGN